MIPPFLLFRFSSRSFLDGIRTARPIRAHLEHLSCAPQTAALRRPRRDAAPLGEEFLGMEHTGRHTANTPYQLVSRRGAKTKNIFTLKIFSPCEAGHETAASSVVEHPPHFRVPKGFRVLSCAAARPPPPSVNFSVGRQTDSVCSVAENIPLSVGQFPPESAASTRQRGSASPP